MANYSQRYMGGAMQAWGWSDTRCSTQAVFVCKASPAMLAPRFTSRFTNSTFQLATFPSTFAAAQLGCNQQGGHLALYQSVQEQVSVPGCWSAHTASDKHASGSCNSVLCSLHRTTVEIRGMCASKATH